MIDSREAFEAWAVTHGGLDLTMHEAMDNEKLPFMCTYYSYTTEIAWRAFANKKVPAQAALASVNEVKQSQAQQSQWISVGEVNNKYGDPETFAERSYYIDEQILQTVPIGSKLVAMPPAPEGDKP